MQNKYFIKSVLIVANDVRGYKEYGLRKHTLHAITLLAKAKVLL